MTTETERAAPAAPAAAVATAPGDLLLGNGAALTMILAWGTVFPLVEQLLLSWDILSTTAARQTIGALALLAMLWARKRVFPLRRSLPWRRIVLLGLFGPALSSTLTTLAVATAGSVAVAIVYSMGPIVAALTARILFRIPLQAGIGIGIGFACLGGLILKAGQLGETEVTGGELFMLASMVAWTWYSVACQRWLAGMSQLEIAALSMLPVGVILALAVALAGVTGAFAVHAPLDATTISLALFIGLVPIGMGNLMWHVTVSRLGVSLTAIYGNLIPVVAVLIATAFGARPTLLHLLGGLVILAGAIYAQVRGRREALPR